MSGRATILFLSGTALAGLALACPAEAQQMPRGSLRSGAPAYVAQQPAAPRPDPAAVGAEPEALRNQPGQSSAVSARQPPRASDPVQAPALRGVTQRQFRPPQPTVAALPPPPPAPAPPPRRRSASEEDPYAALGIRVGAVTLRPSVTNSIGYDTNPQRSSAAGSKGSGFSRHEGELEIQSDWNVHELKGRLNAGYLEFFRNKDASRPDAQGNLDLRLDATRDTRFLIETRLRLDTQRPGSPDLTAAVAGRPQIWQYGGSAGMTHDINRLQLTLRGSVDRSDYEDARLSNGAMLSQKDRNMTQYGLRLRAAYEVTPGFKPFAEAEIDHRDFDEKADFYGYERSSNGLTGRVGSSFEISRQLTGEVSGGYQNRKYDDSRLKNLRGFVGDAAVLWTPTPLTTVTLRGGAELGDTTIAGSSGTTVRRATLEVAHALRRNLTVTGFTNFTRTEYDGQGLREDYSNVGARLEYRLTRTFAVRASFTHERLNSTAQGSDYTANVSLVGLRVQF
ncbi:outer membrane beta-barrel protein [Bosea sp. (in: a-proteobacteria)]|uniref:outer membrane beta-barrel protein n=1 Tax=Bosea sp. (in: a-proteobacteria) TaxID=1871050 RepID=UPI002608FF1B|nr:outer membrane beta-barrel protein [Bosea sp. (in: a-proteobacteria)]MCO5089434.1 outer membrane beta-barrel protein [Bosea sp. (in: a-proteobacteria)]